MFTLFHLAHVVLLFAGLAFGAMTGYVTFGRFGALVGGVVGALRGQAAARVVLAAALHPAVRDQQVRTTAELKALLRNDSCLTPNLVLLELKQRSEVTPDDLLVVVAMMKSEGRRTFGWAALTLAFPQLAKKVPDYHPTASLSECRNAVKPLEAELTEQRTLRFPS